MNKLWHFNGGLRLGSNMPPAILQEPVDAQIPRQLIYPLQQRPGVLATTSVASGERVLKGQQIALADHPLNVPVIAASSGIVRGIENRRIAHPSGLTAACIVIDTDGKDHALTMTANENYQQLEPELIRNRIQQGGIAGLGGAAFPTAIKLNPGPMRALDTLIINGAECEPYISCDACLMQAKAEDIVKGAQVLLHALQINHCIIAIENEMQATKTSLQQAIRKLQANQVQLRTIPSIYPSGGEKQLIRVLTGRETPSGGIPADIGVVCQNVATSAAVYQAVCQGKPLTERIITVTGKGVRKNQNMRVRIGTPIKDLIRQCGGYTQQARRLILGGPVMGFAVPDDDIAVTKSSNCILAAGADEIKTEHQPMPCIRCGDCVRVCPANLLPQQLYWYSRAGDLDKCKTFSLFDCIECGCCEIVCPSHIPLVQTYRAAKGKIVLKNQQAEKAAQAKLRHERRSQRMQHEHTEKAERAKQRKALLANNIQQAVAIKSSPGTKHTTAKTRE